MVSDDLVEREMKDTKYDYIAGRRKRDARLKIAIDQVKTMLKTENYGDKFDILLRNLLSMYRTYSTKYAISKSAPELALCHHCALIQDITIDRGDSDLVSIYYCDECAKKISQTFEAIYPQSKKVS